MKKGFTLIELLAVIVILAVIALIAVPNVLSVISSSKEKAFNNSVNGLIKAAEKVVFDEIANGTNKDVFIRYLDGAEIIYPSGKAISYTGSKPMDGGILIHLDGGITLALHDGTNCVYKKKNDVTTTTILETKEACNQRIIYYQASLPFDNLVTNGDFSSGTTGWNPANGTISVTNNTLKSIANGNNYYSGALINTTSPWIINSKIYVGMKAKANRPNLTNLMIQISGTTSGDNLTVVQTSPIANTTYNLSGVLSYTNQVGNIQFKAYQLYVDSPSATNGEMFVNDAIVFNLTTLYGVGNEPTKEEMDHNLNKVWINSSTNIPMKFTAGGWRNF
jgi:prepilin-type N-terminal cleavage/methylation domain-containing protein